MTKGTSKDASTVVRAPTAAALSEEKPQGSTWNTLAIDEDALRREQMERLQSENPKLFALLSKASSVRPNEPRTERTQRMGPPADAKQAVAQPPDKPTVANEDFVAVLDSALTLPSSPAWPLCSAFMPPFPRAITKDGRLVLAPYGVSRLKDARKLLLRASDPAMASVEHVERLSPDRVQPLRRDPLIRWYDWRGHDSRRYPGTVVRYGLPERVMILLWWADQGRFVLLPTTEATVSANARPPQPLEATDKLASALVADAQLQVPSLLWCDMLVQHATHTKSFEASSALLKELAEAFGKGLTANQIFTSLSGARAVLALADLVSAFAPRRVEKKSHQILNSPAAWAEKLLVSQPGEHVLIEDGAGGEWVLVQRMGEGAEPYELWSKSEVKWVSKEYLLAMPKRVEIFSV